MQSQNPPKQNIRGLVPRELRLRRQEVAGGVTLKLRDVEIGALLARAPHNLIPTNGCRLHGASMPLPRSSLMKCNSIYILDSGHQTSRISD